MANPTHCPQCSVGVIWDSIDGYLHYDGSIGCHDDSGVSCSAAMEAHGIPLVPEISAQTGAPYKIIKQGTKFVVKNNLGETKATFGDRDAALKYLRALYANVPGAQKRASKVAFTGKQKKAVNVKAADANKPHTFQASDDDGDECAVCGKAKDDGMHKGVLSKRAMSEELPPHRYAPGSVPSIIASERACLSCGNPLTHPLHTVAAEKAMTVEIETDKDSDLPTYLDDLRQRSKTFTADRRKQLTKEGKAVDDSFPIENESDLKNAIQSYGRASDKEKAKAHIVQRARALGLTKLLPADWTGSTQKAFLSEINGKTLLTAPASVIAEFAAARSSGNPHFMWMEGRFVGGEEPNRNGAFWSTDDLEFGQPTVANGPLNWLHDGQHVIGTLAASSLVQASAEQAAEGAKPYIAAQAAIWKWLYPDESAVVEMASDAGKLYYSMECISDNVVCRAADCESTVPYLDYINSQGSICDHMRERSDSRRFENPVYLGGAVIVPPVRPGWADATAKVMRENASTVSELAESSFAVLRPDVSAGDWEQMMAPLLTYGAA